MSPTLISSNSASSETDPSGDAARSASDHTSIADQPGQLDDAWITAVYPSLHRAAWKMTGDPIAAEDLAQETLIAAFKAWDSFDGRSSRSTWMHGILIRLTRKHFRYSSRLRRHLQRYAGMSLQRETASDSPDALATAEWKQSIWSKVAKLPRHQAEAITLHYDQQLTYEEIAQAVGCAVGTAKSRVHQGLKRLRQSADLSESFPQ